MGNSIYPSPINGAFPSLPEFLKDNPAWLEEAVNAAEATRITSIPVSTLHTWRSRGGGLPFLKLGSKLVRYQRRALFEWMGGQVGVTLLTPETISAAKDPRISIRLKKSGKD